MVFPCIKLGSPSRKKKKKKDVHKKTNYLVTINK